MKISLNNNINNYSSKLEKKYPEANYIQQKQSFNGVAQSVEAATKTFAKKKSVQKFLQNPKFNKFLKTSMANPGLYEAMLALLITCTARPLTVLATPGAKMEDKQYAAAQSIASGTTGLAFAYIIFNPIKDAIGKIFKDINSQNVKNAFKNFYENSQNSELIQKLVDKKIIPTKDAFNQEFNKQNSNIYKFMEDFLQKGENGSSAKSTIDKLLLSDSNQVEKANWKELSENYSKALNQEFTKIKFNNVDEHKRYLVHDGLSFLKEGLYKIKLSAGAEKANTILNYTSKIILFPLLAAATIWAIPKIMKLVFPNHKKSKNNKNNNVKNHAKSDYSMKNQQLKNNNVFNDMKNKPAVNNKQVSFSGRIGLSPANIYNKVYKKPLATGISKIFDQLAFSRQWFSRKMQDLLQNNTVKKYGLEVLDRDSSGKILKKADTNFYVSNLPNIAAIAGSCLYIFNTIRNKEIDPERKPALCTNMAVVAIFSLLASKGIESVTKPFFTTLAKAHSGLMRNKINFNSMDAWDWARKMIVTTFAFRYLGPVIATPTADKLVRLFNKHKEQQANMQMQKK